MVSRLGLVVGCAGIGLIALGLAWKYAALLGVGVALVVALVVDLVLVLKAPALTVHRTVEPKVVERHGEAWATLRITGSFPRVSRIAFSDQVGTHTEQVAATGDSVRYRVPTGHRGLIDVGPLAIHRVGLFGLALATTSQGAVDHVRVLPRLVPLHNLPRGRRRSAVGADESAEHGGTDLVGLHEYVPGDDLRRLHGPTSARTGRLMVRDDAEPATPHLTIVLDDTAAHYPDHAGDARDFEEAVEVAFALAVAAGELEQPVHLVTVSGIVDESATEATNLGPERQRIRIALADVQPAGGAGPTGHGVQTLRLARGLDTVAVVSGALAPVEEFAGLAARGSSGALLLVDPQVTQVRATGPVAVLRGATSAELARLWDRAVT